MYYISNKNISGEIIDDELIIIDLVRGVYFSCKGGALPLWKAIVAGHDAIAVARILASHSTDSASLTAAAEAWLNNLVNAGVLLEQSQTTDGEVSAYIESLENLTFTPPTLEIHEDLQDILLFDPVHDFDELGWPKQPGN